MTDELLPRWRAYLQASAALPGIDAPAVDAPLRRALEREVMRGHAGPPTPAIIEEGLRAVEWNVVVHGAEPFAWLLPAGDRPEALLVLARAHAAFPGPRWTSDASAAADGALRSLARAPSDASARAFLAAALQAPSLDRWPLLLRAAPFLSGERRATALAHALDAAFELPDEVHAGQAVAAVVLRDPALLESTLSRAASVWSASDARWALLEELASKLPVEHLAAVLDEARHLEPEWSRVNVLAAMEPRLPPELRARWDAVAATIEDEGARFMLDPAPRPEPVAPGEASTVMEALHAWLALARGLAATPESREIASGALQFVRATVDAFSN